MNDSPDNKQKNTPETPVPPQLAQPRQSVGDGPITTESHESAFSVAGAAQSIAPDDPETVAPPTEHLQINKPESRLKHMLRSKKFWFSLVAALFAIAVGLWFFQPTRTWLVNAVGLRVPVVVKTQTAPEADQPSAVLQKVAITVNGVASESDDKGQANLQAPYGDVTMRAEKTGYESAEFTTNYDFDAFLGLLGGSQNGAQQTVDMQLKSIGLPLKFKAVNWLTDQPITTGEFSVEGVVAKPDSEGVVSLKIPPTDAKTVKVMAKFSGSHVDQEFELAIQTDPVQEVIFTPAGHNYFISKASGQLGIYRSNIDGADVQEVVAPSTNETSAINITVSPSGKYALLASTREGKRDSANKLVQKLYILNLSDSKLTAVDEGAWFDFADWAGDTLVYTTATDTAVQRLASVNVVTGQKIDIGMAASYGVVLVSLNSVVYQLNHEASSGSDNDPELRTASVTGGENKNIGNKVKTVSQSDTDKINYQTADNAWHEYNVNTGAVGNISAPASSTRAFLAATSPDGQWRLFIDKVDGKNAIYTKNVADGKEKLVYSATGLSGPVYWVHNMIIFRISDALQTTDYVLPIGGGVAKKIADVTNSASPSSDTRFDFY